jgi:hypothetical protein
MVWSLAPLRGPCKRTPDEFDHTDSATYCTATMSRKKVSTTVYITPEQNELLKQLHDRTKVPVAEFIRQGIDLVLEKYADRLPGQARLGIE